MKRHGHARVDPRSPRAFATCDRCSRLFNHVDLRWQEEWRGRNLQNIRLLVCDDCLDVPQEQLRVIVLPPDPLPILNARPELANMDATDVPAIRIVRLTGQSGSYSITGSPDPTRRDYRITLATGAYGLTGNAANLDFYPSIFGFNPFSSGFSNGFGAGISIGGSSYSIGFSPGFGVGGANASISLAESSGSYGLTGTSATMRRSLRLALTSGVYGLTGHTANLTVTLEGVGTIAGNSGTYSLTGSAAILKITRKLTEATGSYALTGSTAARTSTLNGASGVYALSGSTAAVKATRKLSEATGAYALSGSASAFLLTRKLAEATGSYAFTGSTATVVFASGVTWNPADKAADIALSNGNLTGTISVSHASGNINVRGTKGGITGRYFELVFSTLVTGQISGAGIGLANSTQSLTSYPGNPNGIGYFIDGYAEWPGSGFSNNFGTFTTGDVIGIKLNASTATIYKNGSVIGTATSLPTGTLYPVLSPANQTDSGTVNFGATPMAFLPVGVTSWDGSQVG